MTPTRSKRNPRSPWLMPVLTILAIGFCFVADAFVLRTMWDRRELADGQFRRGYFERFSDRVGIAADNAIVTNMLPTFVLDAHGDLGVPPGFVAVAPIEPGVSYAAAHDGPHAPYVVIGIAAPLDPEQSDLPPAPGDGQLAEALTLTVRDDHLALERWDSTLPWRTDAARLAALQDACAASDSASPLVVTGRDDGIEIRFGHCILRDPTRAAGQTRVLAVLAGPEWLTVARSPAWVGHYWVVWPVFYAIAVKIALFWWGLDVVSAVAASAAPAAGAIFLPLPALLMWPVMTILGATAAVVRATVWAWRRLPRRAHLPATVVLLVLIGAGVASWIRSPDDKKAVPIVYEDQSSASACAVIGYSTVKGEGLRQQRGGIRSALNERCSPLCEHRTAGMAEGGKTMAWARDSYCTSVGSFGADGHVIFLGSVNDDYFWGYLSLPRLFIGALEGGQSWRGNEVPAAAASLARFGAYEAALHTFMDCVRTRRSRLLFLHDFLVTDLVSGRKPERAAMLERRRAVVESAGGIFVDLSQVFAAEVGVTWFNDYVHLSRVGHERVADLACQLMKTGAAQPTIPPPE